MTGVYQPDRVYLVRKQGEKVVLGELVDQEWVDETPGVERLLAKSDLFTPSGAQALVIWTAVRK